MLKGKTRGFGVRQHAAAFNWATSRLVPKSAHMSAHSKTHKILLALAAFRL